MTGSRRAHAIAGKIALYTPPDGKTVRLAVKNEGTVPLGVTNNYFPSRSAMERDTYRHDDTTYGHGMECQPGTWSWQEFPIGGRYNTHVIRPGGIFRVGLRAACWGIAKVPEAGEEPTVLDLTEPKDFEWYGGASPDNPYPHQGQAQGMRGWNAASMHRNTGEDDFIRELIGALDFQKNGVKLEGKATVTAHAGRGGVLSHWTVRFDNEGDMPFIGTVVFEEAQKNDGIGLESMGVPNRGSAAEQRIEHNGNYGILAQSGRTVRLGVRGYGHHQMKLPSEGSVEIPLRRFKRESSQKNDAFFDRDEVLKKQREKLDKVRFFEKGRPINEEIKPIVYRGREADARSPFDAPRVVVKAVPHGDETPGGGWIIEMENRLPRKDKDGVLGFVGTLKLGDTGYDPAQLPPKKFLEPGQRNVWFLPRNAQLGASTAKAGVAMSVGTRGLGWFAEIRLPRQGDAVDTDQDVELWGWRPDQYRRANLAPQFLKRHRRGPDF